MTTPEPSRAEPTDTPGFGLAVAAEAIYLVNLMLLPGLAFLVLIGLWLRHRHDAPPLARCHLAQTVAGSLWAGVLLVVANGLIVLIGGYQSPHTWVVVVLYFTTCHTTLICFGALGLARALAGRSYVYPLIGRPCDAR